jgi:hypothetical protein
MKIKEWIRRSERGQAIAEYMPLIPPMLLLSFIFLIPLADNSGAIYCMVANEFQPEICEAPDGSPRFGGDEGDPMESETPDPPESPDEGSPSEPVCTELQESEGGSQCEHDPMCYKLPGVNAGTFSASSTIYNFVIKAGKEYNIFESGYTDDGCYQVDIDGNDVSWMKVGHGSGCKDVSHGQAWKKPLCPTE